MTKNIAINQNQLEAINSTSDKILIVAPAGSGKTLTLVSAIKKYKDNNPDAQVVAITFTKKAANNLNDRLKKYNKIFPSTIHSWAYQELEKLSNLLQKEDPYNTFKIKLLQEEKVKEILNELIEKRKYYYIKIDILYSYIMGNYNMDLSMPMKSMFQALEKDYIQYKEDMGLYDFTDLPKYLLDKLKDYDRYIEDTDALFVDEFQDVDDIQLELFNRVLAAKRFYIGDPRQSIYIFRGASEKVMEKLTGFKKYVLDINYRSYQEIIDFATTYRNRALVDPLLFSGLLESFPSDINSMRGSGGEVYVLNRLGSAYKVNEYIKEKGQEIVEKFLEKGSMILCRKNKEVREIKKLGYDNVQTIHQAKGLEYKDVVITDFDIDNEEDINIAYVGMTRAEDSLLAAHYNALIKILVKLSKENKIKSPTSLF